ncbi:MAG: DUF4149 domain-containing protein [Janthinobacterium lividum]
MLMRRLFGVVTMLWVGSLLTVGYLTAPVLFATLARTEAGDVVSRLLRIEAILGVVCAVVLWVLCNRLLRAGATGYRRERWIVLLMLACTLLGYFALQPFMHALRVAAERDGVDLLHSPNAWRFGVLHAVSSLLYLIQSLAGLALVWLLPPMGGPAVSRAVR